jgi:crossover junction endodeoxyribonuclease RuvC
MAGTKRKRVRADVDDERCLVPAGCDWPVILGVDPGTRAMGYGAIVLAPDGPRLLLAGVIAPRAGGTLSERLAEIASELPRVFARCRPACLALERAFSAVNVQSAFRIGESRGVVLACAAQHGVRVAEYSPAQAKKAVIGRGAASKEQVAAMLPRLLGASLDGLPLDATDALALALTHARELAFERRLPNSRVPLPLRERAQRGPLPSLRERALIAARRSRQERATAPLR